MASSRTRELDQIIADLGEELRSDLIILAIPSHDKKNKPLNNQEVWASEAMELFAHIFGGATAFKTFKGVFKSEDGDTLLWDNPILIEAYAERDAVENRENLNRLLDFIKRMKRGTHQESVMLVLNNYARFL